MADQEFRRCRERLDQTWYDPQPEQSHRVLALMVQARAVRSRKTGWYRTDDLADAWPGDEVVLETERGTTPGLILSVPGKQYTPTKGLKNVVRRLVDDAENRWQQEKVKERQDRARQISRELIGHMRLNMKLVDVEYVPWENRSVFYFVAEGRVDFRELVKELSRSLRCRIEMRQIGPRDETKMVGGIGRCGREYCCATHLTEFKSVRTKMAKEQGLVVNQEKITGHCRKLLCCLAYERDVYVQLRSEMPRLGTLVKTPEGTCKITELQIIRQAVKVQPVEGGPYKDYPLSRLKPVKDSSDAPGAVQFEVGPSEAEDRARLLELPPALVDEKSEQEDGKRSSSRRRSGRRRSRRSTGDGSDKAQTQQESAGSGNSGGRRRSRRKPPQGKDEGSQPRDQQGSAQRDEKAGGGGEGSEGKSTKRRRRRGRGRRGGGKGGDQGGGGNKPAPPKDS